MSKKLPVAIQVYGLRDLLENTPENFKEVMQKVKDLGYDGVELAGLYGLKPEYVKEVLDEVGLVPVSAHVAFAEMMENLDQILKDYSVIGVKYLVMPYMAEEYRRENLDSQLKSELLTALQPAFARIGANGVRYSALPAHTMEIADALNEQLSSKWRELRGIEIVSFGVNSVKADEEDEKTIKEMQREAAYRDPTRAAGSLVHAQAEAMKSAAANANAGPAMAFMGMNMAGQAGGAGVQNLYAMGQQQAQAQAAGEWTCSCGQTGNTGKFCMGCGRPKPEQNSWKCVCGTVNTGKFCSECGKPRPENTTWTCSCGAVNQGKFCSECGKAKPNM